MRHLIRFSFAKIETKINFVVRSGAVGSSLAHNPKVAGSSPASATKPKARLLNWAFIPKTYN